MLPRSHRIPTTQFPGVTRGKTLQNELFRVVIKLDSALRHPKCAVIVPNKVAKTAISRNKVRRQVYEALHSLLPHLPNAYICIFPKKVPLEQSEIFKSLKTLF